MDRYVVGFGFDGLYAVVDTSKNDDGKPFIIKICLTRYEAELIIGLLNGG